MFLPFLMRDGRDIPRRIRGGSSRPWRSPIRSTSTASHRGLDVGNIPETISPVFLKQADPRPKFAKKGLDKVYRYYEVRGMLTVAILGTTVPKRCPQLRLMDALIDRLDDWVEKGIEPPPSRADVDIGFGNHMNAIGTPETACPVGVYHGFPPSLGSRGVGSTARAKGLSR